MLIVYICMCVAEVPTAQAIEHRMMACLLNDELERMWKEAASGQCRLLSRHLAGERLEKTKKHARHDSRLLRIDLNHGPPESEVEASPTHPERSVRVGSSPKCATATHFSSRLYLGTCSSAVRPRPTDMLQFSVLSCKLVLCFFGIVESATSMAFPFLITFPSTCLANQNAAKIRQLI
jgi:hypothetical protein